MFQMTEVTSRTVDFRTSAAASDGDKKALSVRRYEAKPPENLELVSFKYYLWGEETTLDERAK